MQVCKNATLGGRILRARWCHSSTAQAIAREAEEEIVYMRSEAGKKLLSSLVSASMPANIIECEHIADYFKKRLSISKEFSFTELRVLSSLGTFPLSLAYGINRLRGHKGEERNVSVLVVGARAEASLPRLWWRKALFSLRSIDQLEIVFMGPHLPTLVSGSSKSIMIPQALSLSWRSTLAVHRQLSVDNLAGGNCYFHNYSHPQSLLNSFDMFALFNPGFGAPSLRESWVPSLNLLLATSKPLLISAHSSYDLHRDLRTLDNVYSPSKYSWLLEPEQNPFRSFKRTFDEQEDPEAQVVTTNDYLYVIRGGYTARC